MREDFISTFIVLMMLIAAIIAAAVVSHAIIEHARLQTVAPGKADMLHAGGRDER